MKEDSILFELLEEKGVSARGCPLPPLRNAHEKIRAILAELSEAAAAYETSNPEAEAVVQSLVTLAETYPHHLWIENFLLFPMTNKLLNADEHALLAERFNRAEAACSPASYAEMVSAVERLESVAVTLRQTSATHTTVHELQGPQ